MPGASSSSERNRRYIVDIDVLRKQMRCSIVRHIFDIDTMTAMNHSSTADDGNQSGFPTPFSLDQLRQDILDIYLLQLRATYLFSNDQKIWALTGKSGIRDGSIWIGSQQPADYGLSYADVAESEFAKAIEQQFSFAFAGLDTLLCEPMEPETMHTWVAAYLTDLQSSAFAGEWSTYGGDVTVSRCLHACELANARVVLEGGENFFPYMSDKADEGNKAEGALTVRQMALLAGMEEMTIRTAISRKGPSQLKAFKDDRRTLVSLADAKEWLVTKGRYIPISRQSHAGSVLDLTRTAFTSAFGIAHALTSRWDFVTETEPNPDHAAIFDALATRFGLKDVNFYNKDLLLNNDLMRELAVLLRLPPDLLILRVKEAALHEEIANTEAAVRDSIEKLQEEQR